MRGFVSAGFDQKLTKDIHLSFEAVHGWKNFIGIRGNPLALRGGIEYNLSDQTTLIAIVNWNANYKISQQVEH